MHHHLHHHYEMKRTISVRTKLRHVIHLNGWPVARFLRLLGNLLDDCFVGGDAQQPQDPTQVAGHRAATDLARPTGGSLGLRKRENHGKPPKTGDFSKVKSKV